MRDVNARVLGPSPWGYEAEQRMMDREDELRAARPNMPSSSVTPRRCATCHEWSRPDDRGECVKCGAPYMAAALDGLPIVRG